MMLNSAVQLLATVKRSGKMLYSAVQRPATVTGRGIDAI
jgi:hypothetical protein